MKQIVETIYNQSGENWDGTFGSTDDHVKDTAVRHYLLTDGQNRLTELFPPCCDGSEVRLLKELFRNPSTFKKLYIVLMTEHDRSERFESEACQQGTSWELSKSIEQDDQSFAEKWGDVVYAFCENALIAACEKHYQDIDDEYQRSLAENYAAVNQ